MDSSRWYPVSDGAAIGSSERVRPTSSTAPRSVLVMFASRAMARLTRFFQSISELLELLSGLDSTISVIRFNPPESNKSSTPWAALIPWDVKWSNAVRARVPTGCWWAQTLANGAIAPCLIRFVVPSLQSWAKKSRLSLIWASLYDLFQIYLTDRVLFPESPSRQHHRRHGGSRLGCPKDPCTVLVRLYLTPSSCAQNVAFRAGGR